MQTVHAKFWVSEIKHHGSYGGHGDAAATVELLPVTADTPENATWSRWTPSGKIEMLINNPGAIDQFELGAEYLVEFRKAD